MTAAALVLWPLAVAELPPVARVLAVVCGAGVVLVAVVKLRGKPHDPR